jgi:O-antigen/teichoic acid export membrane protein
MIYKSARFNIIAALIAKILSMGVAVFSVPILLGLLGQRDYGTWVTLTSLIVFIGLLNLGVGNSLQNSVAAMTPTSEESVRHEFVGFFQMLCGIALIAVLVFAFLIPYAKLDAESHFAAWILYTPLLLLLPLMIASNVLQGARATGLQAVLQSMSTWLFFGFVLILFWSQKTPSLEVMALAWSGFYAIALLSIFFLGLRVLQLPISSLTKLSLTNFPKGRLKVGFEFFALQLASLVLYGLGNSIIFSQLGPIEVARYDVLNKIFQVALSLYTIMIGVMWSEIAKARADADEIALARMLRMLAGGAIFFAVACLSIVFYVPLIIDQWTQHRIQVTRLEALSVAVLVAIQSLAYVGAVFMNAFEKIRPQIILAFFSIALMIPLAYFFISKDLGIISVPLAATLLTLLPMIACNIYAIRLVRSVVKTTGNYNA